jgi:hypothetical protein
MNKTVEISTDGSVVGGTAAKQPYTSPKLNTYGDLREITMQIGLSGNPDGLLGGLNTILRTSILV